MAKKRIIATLHNMSHVPADSTYRGDGEIDFYVEEKDTATIEKIADKKVEIDEKSNEVFRKPGYVKPVEVKGKA